jgi:hypothetical protein
LHFEKLRPIIPTMVTEDKGGQAGPMSADVEGQPQTQEIVLAKSLTLEELAAKAGGMFQTHQVDNIGFFDDEGTGSGLPITVDDGFTIRGATLRFRQRSASQPPYHQGFSLDEGKLDEHMHRQFAINLDLTAVIFDHSDGSVTFVNPRPSPKTVSGLRIAVNLGATKFFGPMQMFGGEIAAAKEMGTPRETTGK